MTQIMRRFSLAGNELDVSVHPRKQIRFIGDPLDTLNDESSSDTSYDDGFLPPAQTGAQLAQPGAATQRPSIITEIDAASDGVAVPAVGPSSGPAGGDVPSADEPPRGCFRRCCSCFCQVLRSLVGCAGRDVAKKNAWVEFPDRMDRIVKIATSHRAILAEQANTRQGRGLISCIRSLWWHVLGLKHALHVLIVNTLALVDKKTGLPKSLLRRWVFLELAKEGAHGYLYTGRFASASGAKLYAIRIRDKSIGVVARVMNRSRGPGFLAKELTRPMGFSCTHEVLRRLELGREPFSHGALVGQYAFYDNKEWFVEVTEYMRGGSLLEFLQDRRGPLNEYEACEVCARLLLALQYLHSRRLLHRDVRLQQIMLAENGKLRTAKLGDFWCVERIPKKGVLWDRSKPVDPASVAPEVLKTGAWSEQADMWSSGCVLFELVHGHPPFGGKGTAVLHRICTETPEFNRLCGTVSSSADSLLRRLLSRDRRRRPASQEALDHEWFRLYAHGKPELSHHHKPRRLHHVSIIGKIPKCRASMKAENLLTASNGSFNKGFSTHMGSTYCVIDFEIYNAAESQEYWVTHVVISVWGSVENPKKIQLQCAERADTDFVDVASCTVQSRYDLAAQLEVGRPMRYARLILSQNFGGSLGIAVRRVAFYGYEVMSVNVRLDLDMCTFSLGASVHVHSGEITNEQIEEGMVHDSLLSQLDVGSRIPGSIENYKILQSIASGAAHRTTYAMSQEITLPEGNHVATATFQLSHYADVANNSTGPKLTVTAISETSDQTYERHVLFEMESLTSSPGKLDDVLQRHQATDQQVLYKGFFDGAQLISQELDINTDFPFKLEFSFQNNCGTVYMPKDPGLRLFYVPLLRSPASESDLSDVSERGHEVQVAARPSQSELVEAETGVKRKAKAVKNADNLEQELQDALQELQDSQVFGRFGPADAVMEEPVDWSPEKEEARRRQLEAMRGDVSERHGKKDRRIDPDVNEGDGKVDVLDGSHASSTSNEGDTRRLGHDSKSSRGSWSDSVVGNKDKVRTKATTHISSSESVMSVGSPKYVLKLARRAMEEFHADDQKLAEAKKLARLAEAKAREKKHQLDRWDALCGVGLAEGPEKLKNIADACISQDAENSSADISRLMLCGFTPAAPPPTPRGEAGSAGEKRRPGAGRERVNVV